MFFTNFIISSERLGHLGYIEVSIDLSRNAQHEQPQQQALAIVSVEHAEDAIAILPIVPVSTMSTGATKTKTFLDRAHVTFNNPWQKWHFKQDRTKK